MVTLNWTKKIIKYYIFWSLILIIIWKKLTLIQQNIMSKLAIILEDMRLGGPQKQLIYFLQECSKSNSSKKYLVILPKQSKKNYQNF